MKKQCTCGKMMRFLRSSNNKPIPVIEATLHADEVSALDAGMEVMFDGTRHTNHFSDCPDSKLHRRTK